ncbi:hypothetical protein HDU83_004981 [Entophlyctis luteolus]|nr:hypothetical protein HDU83_004981 [Entophlyctis luteolus]
MRRAWTRVVNVQRRFSTKGDPPPLMSDLASLVHRAVSSASPRTQNPRRRGAAPEAVIKTGTPSDPPSQSPTVLSTVDPLPKNATNDAMEQMFGFNKNGLDSLRTSPNQKSGFRPLQDTPAKTTSAFSFHERQGTQEASQHRSRFSKAPGTHSQFPHSSQVPPGKSKDKKDIREGYIHNSGKTVRKKVTEESDTEELVNLDSPEEDQQIDRKRENIRHERKDLRKSSRRVDEEVVREETRAPKKEKKATAKQPRDILLPDGISIVNLSALLGITLDNLVHKMKLMGFENMSPDFVLNTEDSSLIVLEFGMRPIVRESSPVELNFKPRPEPDDWSKYPYRPPVVTIMGHVDHGKTTLLDTLRKTSVAAGEAGGITQHIGAFNVTLASGKRITFLDTPGHAAFSAMRSRGARVTDIVVLVVAADDGVMPQTVEALKFAKEAGVQIIVAINKCDKPGANPSKVKENLIRYDVLVEDYGGEIPSVEVSGLTGLGLDQLEETIIAVSEMAELRGDSAGRVEATIIESRMVKGKGNVTTVLVSRGTLRSGQILVAGTTWCRVRALSDENGRAVREVGPSCPVEVSGWKDLPDAGELVLEAESEGHAKEVISSRAETRKRQELIKSIEEMNLTRMKARAFEESKSTDSSEKEESEPENSAISLPVILKGDVHGSVEAVLGVIEGLPNHEVCVKVIASGVGQVTDSDVERAYAANARIIAFNVPSDKKVATLAQNRKVPIDSYQIIYNLIDDLQERMLDYLPKEEVTTVIGEADVLQIFELHTKSKEPERVAGCRIMSGKVVRNEKVRLIRNDQVLFVGQLKTFRHFKKDITEASKSQECGMSFDGFNTPLEGDRVQCFSVQLVRREKLSYK